MNSEMPDYNKCAMKKAEHITVYLISVAIGTVIVYLFYHLTAVSVVAGIAIGFLLEKMYADSTVKKRKKKLLLQFRDFLEAMNVAARAGNVEYQAVKSAYRDLQISYSRDADIVREIGNILLEYENGGKQLKVLFQDFGERSGLEDIQSFATIFSVIEGKSDNFADIVAQTEEIIGDKIEIEREIDTTVLSAKTETYMMLVMPIVIVVMMSGMGGGLLDALFTTALGHLAATVALVIFIISFVMAVKSTEIDL